MHVSLVIKDFKIHELENHCSCTEAPPEKKIDASETLFRDSRFEFQYFQISNEHSGLSYKTSSHSSEGNEM